MVVVKNIKGGKFFRTPFQLSWILDYTIYVIIIILIEFMFAFSIYSKVLFTKCKYKILRLCQLGFCEIIEERDFSPFL